MGDEVLPLSGGTGYHDHSWGFWQGVSWQWGQVQHDGLSILYGQCSRRQTQRTPAASPAS